MNKKTIRAAVPASLLLGIGWASAQDHTHHVQPRDEPTPAAEERAGHDKHAREDALDHAAGAHRGHAPGQRGEEGAKRSDDDLMHHEGMDHGEMDHGERDHGSPDQAGMDHRQMGHGQPAEDGLDHGEMDHGEMDHSQMGHAMPAGRHEPRTPIPVLTDADRAAAFQDLADHATHDQRIVHMVQFNRFEVGDGDHGSGFAWEGTAWVGNDWNRLWLRSEGERVSGDTEAADLEVLYGRPVARWWDAVVGLRHDFKPGDSRTWAAVGVMGLAPQKFEIEATAYVGESGDLAGSFEAEYEFLITNRLILQPLFEFTLYSDDDPLRGIGSGLSTAELGLRLRYEFDRQFAPYVGVVRERAFGSTADLRREEAEGVDDTLLVAGIRFWF